MEKASSGLEVAEAKHFLNFYTNMMDNHKSSFKYHLSETAVLDWFGKTVKGSRNIGVFLNSSTTSCTHHFTNVKPAARIGFRDTHVVNLPNNNKETKVPERTTNLGNHTPPNPTTSRGARIVEHGQGDGLHNCLESSPVKKSRVVDDEDAPVKFLVAEGCLEFAGKSSKKLQRQTQWSRPCKLHIAYKQRSVEDCTVFLMIYEGSLKCRRNLMKDFDDAVATTSE